MEKLIKTYGYKDAVGLSEFLLNYQDTLDYRYLFASKEWLLSFLEVYKPKDNFLILSENDHNYFSLSVLDNKLVFTGDPFNDFNGVFISDPHDQYDFRKIIQYFSEFSFAIKWVNLFEPRLIKKLSKSDRFQEGIIGLKILREGRFQDYDKVVSSRIRRMYDKFSDSLRFSRIFGAEIKNNPDILKNLLSTRRDKLLNKKKEEYNLSFEQKFNEFITKLISFDSLWKNIFIDYCVHKDTGAIMASTINFVKDKIYQLAGGGDFGRLDKGNGA